MTQRHFLRRAVWTTKPDLDLVSQWVENPKDWVTAGGNFVLDYVEYHSLKGKSLTPEALRYHSHIITRLMDLHLPEFIEVFYQKNITKDAVTLQEELLEVNASSLATHADLKR